MISRWYAVARPFTVLVDTNSAEKSTIVDSIVLSHRDVLPGTTRPPAAVLSKGTVVGDCPEAQIGRARGSSSWRPRSGSCLPSRTLLVDGGIGWGEAPLHQRAWLKSLFQWLGKRSSSSLRLGRFVVRSRSFALGTAVLLVAA